MLFACASPSDDLAPVSRIYARLLAVSEAPIDYPWPPVLKILDDRSPNAFAIFAVSSDGQSPGVPAVIVTTGMLSMVSPSNEDYYAFLLGHELAHHVLRHVIATMPAGEIPSSLYSRENEFAADSLGTLLAMKAGYSFSLVRTGIRTCIEHGLEYPEYVAIGASHPTFKQRLARLDTENAAIWKSLSGFENGVLFLQLEQYQAAEQCFEQVAAEFPGAHEAWANLGYAILMQYCDALDVDDIKQFTIGQIVTGGYYRRAPSLEHMLRGADDRRWWTAIDALREAVRLNPASVVATSTLGLAYLVRPDGTDMRHAARYLTEAAAIAERDTMLDPSVRATILVNAAVLAMEESPQDALDALGRVDTLEQSIRARYPHYCLASHVRSAVNYNRAVLLAMQRQHDALRKSVALFAAYLKTTVPSPWWNIAYERYTAACAAAHCTAEDRDALQRDPAPRMRPATSLALGNGGIISVLDPVDSARAALPDAVTIPLAGHANLMRYIDRAAGVSFLAGTNVLAVIVDRETSPGVRIRDVGLGSHAMTLHVGMPKDSADAALAAIPYTFKELFADGVPYRAYGSLGLALRIVKGKVKEIVLTAISC